jgi:hypothetical protein
MDDSSNILILVADTTNFSELKNYFLKYPSAKIFSLNFLSHDILSNHKINHKVAEDFLTDKDYLKIDNLTKNATTNWYKHDSIKNKLKFLEINLGSLMQLELYHYFLPIYTNVVLFESIISKINPSLIVSATFIDDYIEHTCFDKNISYVLVDKKSERSLVFDEINIKINLFKFPISIKISKKIFLFIKNKFEKLIYFFLGFKNTSLDKSSILLVDFNPALYDDLLKNLSKLNKTILLLNTRRPAVWNFNSFKIIFNTKCKIVSLSKFKNSISEEINLNNINFNNNKNDLWTNNDDFKDIFSFGSYTLWPSIKTSFKKIVDERFSESIEFISLTKTFFSKTCPSLILEWSETAQEEQTILQIAKQFKIKTLYLQHAMAAAEKISANMGSFMSHLSHSFLSDLQIVWGSPAQKYGLSHNNTSILSPGSPRHDKFFNFKSSTASGIILFAPSAPSSISSKNIATNSVQIFDKFIRETCMIINNIPNKKLLVKPHPTPFLLFDIKKLVKEVDSNISVTYSSNILDILNNSELIITTNNSTIAIEAMMLNKPVISLQTEPSFLDEQIVKMNAVISITKVSDIENTVKKLLNDSNLQRELLSNSKKFLDYHFSNHGTASKQFSKILDDLS